MIWCEKFYYVLIIYQKTNLDIDEGKDNRASFMSKQHVFRIDSRHWYFVIIEQGVDSTMIIKFPLTNKWKATIDGIHLITGIQVSRMKNGVCANSRLAILV